MGHDDYQLSKISRLYYDDGMTLKRIGERMNVSIATVSRSLVEARRRGIVEITIRDEMGDFRDLESTIERKFGLAECRIVRSSDRSEDVYREMATALSGMLSRTLRPGMLVGLSWGQTLKSVGEYLPALQRARCDTIPILGAIGAVETGLFPNAISRSFADRLGGKSYLVNAPAILDTKSIRETIEAESTFRPIKLRWEELDVVLLSVSGLDRKASVSHYQILERTAIDELVQAGAICATNFIMLDGEGHEVRSELTNRLLRLTLPELLNVKRRVILSFGKSKVAAVRAALRGGIATTLVTDRDTAAGI